METIKLKIHFDDRLGLVLDVAGVLFNYGLNIVALQLMNKVMFLEIEKNQTDFWPILKNDLEKVATILSVDRITDMPYQTREKQIEAIINSITPSDALSDAYAEIVGESPAIKGAIFLASQVAATDSAILLTGESGTGKELFARAIHMSSLRKEKVFVPVNCGAIPENILESELFGYVEGAFSGAKKGGRVGLFQFASGGTIFLDEISELPMHLQVKLLRVLQENSVRPLGANEEVAVNCRVIAASNRNIEEMVHKGQFRGDLFYRLNVIPIQIPPLRHRKSDIPLLSDNFLAKFTKKGGLEKHLSLSALDKLAGYDWPGNVRELENVIQRAAHLCREKEISDRFIIFDGDIEGITPARPEAPACERLKSASARAEKELIAATLKRMGSLRRTAQELGVSHTTIANKMKTLGIEKDSK